MSDDKITENDISDVENHYQDDGNYMNDYDEK
jgi:hypothetical protein